MMRSSLLPRIGGFAGFLEVADWRHLDRPTQRIREEFDGYQATYRVIISDTDTAQLAVWQTGATGPEPFNANRNATGTGCVALHRQPGSVTSNVIDCPSPMMESQPESTGTSWGRDSEALAIASVVIEGSVDQEVRWLMTKEVGGIPRSTPRTLEQVVVAVHQAVLTDDQGLVLSDLQEHSGTVTGVVTAHASGVDPVDSRRDVQAQACAKMTVVLEDLHPNSLFTEIPCTNS